LFKISSKIDRKVAQMGVLEPKLKYKLRFRKRPVRKEDIVEQTVEEEQAPPPPFIEIPKPLPTVFDEIFKSQQDSKYYRGLILENGIKVMLISDPTAEKSAACLCVEVGHMSDPADLPGIAHLTEHVLFLGSQKYPEENHFRSFVSENGGVTNAQTFADVTKYFFDIMPEKLDEALDRFAQMFISPLFKESSVTREISAVNSEHEKNVSVDAWRTRMVNKTLANPNHPYSKFSTGNVNTLMDFPKRYGIDVRAELVEFHGKWYRSGNLMNLAVIGKNSLDKLEEFVRNHFVDGIENKNVELPLWEDEVYMKDQMMTKTFIEPVMDVRSMTLSFPTPDLKRYYHSRVRSSYDREISAERLSSSS
jgi:insulysin